VEEREKKIRLEEEIAAVGKTSKFNSPRTLRPSFALKIRG